MQVTVVANSDGFALHAMQQIDNSYDVEHVDDTRPRALKVETDVKLPTVEATSRYARQRSWLAKDTEEKTAGRTSWRPLQMHRLSAKHWLINLDHQTQWSTPWTDGLKHVQYDPESAA